LQQYTSLDTLFIRNTSYENTARILVNIPAAARQVTLRGILPEEIHLVGPDQAACVFHLDSDAPNFLTAAVNLSQAIRSRVRSIRISGDELVAEVVSWLSW
jgi:hypothetical protein